MSKDRVEIFSDAVFAIIMTLLVLELHPPEMHANASFNDYLTAMVPIWPKIAIFILTFASIAIYWMNHYYFFRHIKKVDVSMVWLNILLLLWICFLPFPTAMLGNNFLHEFPALLYAVNSFLLALTFFAFRKYALHKKLFKDDIETLNTIGPKRSIPAIILYGAAIPLAFVNVVASLLCFILVPIVYFLPNLIVAKRRNSVHVKLQKKL